MDYIKNIISEYGTMYLVSQCISIVAAILLLLSFQQRTHKRIILMQAVSGLLFGTQYLMLKAYEGAVCNYIGMIRCLVYSRRTQSKIVDSKLCPTVFAIAFGVVSIITYKNPLSLLPTVAMMISSFVLWSPKTQQLRALTFPTSVMWLIYNFASKSYVAFLTEAFCEVSIIIGLIRFRDKKKAKNPEANEQKT